MRIALVCREFPPETRRGEAGAYFYYLARGLAALGEEVEIFAGTLRNFCWEETQNGLRIRRCSLEGFEKAVAQVVRKTMLFETMAHMENAIAFARAVGPRHMMQGYDVIETPDYGGENLFLNLRSDVKKVVKLHSPLLYLVREGKLTLDMRAAFWLCKRSLARADLIISPTHFLADLLRESLLPGREIYVVPDGIDLTAVDSSFDPRFDLHSYLSAEREAEVVVFTGRLERERGVDLLAKAIPLVIRDYPKAFFVFAGPEASAATGSGPIKRALAQKGMESRAKFLGAVPQGDLYNILMRSSVFILPSNFENFPFSLLEAMAAGVAIVATRVGGIPEIVEDGTSAVLVPPKDEEALASSIVALLEDEAKAEELGRQARLRVEREFDYLTLAKRTRELYESATS